MSDSNAVSSRLSPGQRRAFAIAQKAARQVVERRLRVLRLTRDAYAKLGRNERSLVRVSDDLRVIIRLTRAWVRRDYVAVPWRAILSVVAAVIYFVNPADLIPDVLAGIGFVDDAAVVSAVVRSLHTELNAFRRWEAGSERMAAITPLRNRPAA